MSNRIKVISIIASLAFILCIPMKGYSQKMKEYEIEGSMLANDLDLGITFNLALKYNYWINQYFGFSVGGQFGYSKVDLNFDSPINNNAVYYLDGNIYELNGIIGLKLACPVYKNVGVMADASFLFDPIPYNLVSAEQKVFHSNQNYPDENDKSKFAFTHFNPAYALQVGLYYDLKKETGRARVAVGCGISNHNSYNAYYRTQIDGVSLKDNLQLKPDKIGLLLFIRFSGF